MATFLYTPDTAKGKHCFTVIVTEWVTTWEQA